MDINSIPTCALHRQAGTVIVRIKMDKNNCRPFSCQDFGRTYHRTSVCEQCTRTRLNSYSDCDSGLVERCRPYKLSAAKSRYVNVCAAVCLLLLVGGLSPESSAAPHWSRNMDRQKRASGSQENSLWGNPCDYSSAAIPSEPLKYTKSLAEEVATQAKYVLKLTAQHKDTIARSIDYESFDQWLPFWNNTYWLRSFDWFREEILPITKTVNHEVPSDYVNNLMKNIDDILPALYKALKVIVAGLNSINENRALRDDNLNNNIISIMHEVRAVLCLFSDVMRSRNLPIEPLNEDQIPKFKTENDMMTIPILIYRDTINHLEYIVQVFSAMKEIVPDQA